MQRAALIFNPNAGRPDASRLAALQIAAQVLRARGIQAHVLATEGPGTAGRQAAEAAAQGTDLIFACGGDGTLHEVIQGLAHNPNVTIGIVPLGSANAMARHLGLSFDPAESVRQQLSFTARPIPLGRVTCASPAGQAARFFVVMAGAGPDGMLVYRMLARGKHRLGRSMYYLRTARLFLSSSFPAFTVHTGSDDVTSSQRDAISAMVI